MIRNNGFCYAACALSCVAVGWAVAGPPRAQKATDAHIAKLIAQLGDDDVRQRELASRELEALDEALPQLREAAAKSNDAEVRRRSQRLIAAMEHRREDQLIKEAVAQVNEEGLDLFIDRMVLQKGYATEAHYRLAVQIAKALAQRAFEAGAVAPKALEQNFLAMPETTAEEAHPLLKGRLRMEGTTEPSSVHGCLLFSSGSLRQLNSTSGSILFVNGDIEGLNATQDSIIICTGNIKSFNFTRGSIIFCKGVVEQMNSTQNNAVFVLGELRRLNHTVNNVIEASQLGRCTVSEGNHYLNRERVDATSSRNDRFTKSVPSVLELFRFFDPKRVGLEYRMADGDVLVGNIVKDTPMARAGLRPGDLILAVERAKFLTSEQFVQLLRRRVVAGSALLKVQREDRIMSLTVQFDR